MLDIYTKILQFYKKTIENRQKKQKKNKTSAKEWKLRKKHREIDENKEGNKETEKEVNKIRSKRKQHLK